MPRNASLSLLLIVSAVVLMTGESLMAQTTPIPLAYTVKYWTHADPNDPNSPVQFEIRLKLKNMDSDGDAIGWDVTELRVREYDPNGVLSRSWTDADPNVPTSDGLWWVSHADPNTPVDSEFTVPPHLIGTATANDTGYADLEYDIEGVESTPSPLYEVSANINYVFVEADEEEPTGSGSDEPTEVPTTLGDPGA